MLSWRHRQCCPLWDSMRVWRCQFWCADGRSGNRYWYAWYMHEIWVWRWGPRLQITTRAIAAWLLQYMGVEVDGTLYNSSMRSWRYRISLATVVRAMYSTSSIGKAQWRHRWDSGWRWCGWCGWFGWWSCFDDRQWARTPEKQCVSSEINACKGVHLACIVKHTFKIFPSSASSDSGSFIRHDSVCTESLRGNWCCNPAMRPGLATSWADRSRVGNCGAIAGYLEGMWT